MSRLVLKAAPDDDKYVIWSTIVDAPIGYATMDELKKFFGRETSQEMFNRADTTGTSDREGWFGWDSNDSLIVGEVGNKGFFSLHRSDLKSFMDAYMENVDGVEGENRILVDHCTPCGE